MSEVKIIKGGQPMTKIVYHTDLKEVTSLRFHCQKCGTIVQRKIAEDIRYDDNRCIQCGTKIPDSVRMVTMHLGNAIEQLRGNDNFTIELETEKEN